MKRIGLILWTAGWGYLLLHGTLPTHLPTPALLMMASLSLFCAYGRVGEGTYVAGAIWPFFFPARASEIVAGVLLLGTGSQIAATLVSRTRSAYAGYRRSADWRDEWLYDEEEAPEFTRQGAPLNRAAWRRLSPEAFEEEVLALFEADGFQGELTSLSGDEGIDIALTRDGQFSVVQCKHYRKPVGQPPLRDFAGAMRSVGATIGYFVISSEFTEPARRWAEGLEDPCILLIDGRRLVQWSREGRLPRQ